MDFRVQMAKDVGQTVAEAVAKCKDPVLEPKYNGWRCVIIRHADGVDIYKPSRNSDPSKCYTGQLPELEADLMQLPVGTILDGELVAMEYNAEDGQWVQDFYRIHTCMRSNDTVAAQRAGIRLVAFDIIEAGGSREIASKPLPQRREVLTATVEAHRLQLVDVTIQMPATQEAHEQLVAAGFEGSMVKDQTKPYGFAKRGHGFFKVKWTRTIDTVIMDVIMDGKGQHAGKAGRLVVGQYKDGVLTEVCKVNFLDNKHRDEATADKEGQIGRVYEVKIYGWAKDGPLHPTAERLRDGDKEPAECVWSRV